MKKIVLFISFALISMLGFSSCAVYTLDDYCGGSYYQSHYYHRPAVHHHHKPVVHHHHTPAVHHHHSSHHKPVVHHHTPAGHHHKPTVQHHHTSRPTGHHHPSKPSPRPRNDYNHHRRDSRK
jgi:hypothetical protein